MKRSSEFLLLILLVVACSAPLVIRHDYSGPARIMENLCVMSSQETWMRQCGGEENAWLMPTWNGRPRVNKPPMLVWMNMLGWSDFDWETSSIDALIGRTRLVASGMALLALLGIYGCARCLRGVRFAQLAMLIAGSCFVFVKYGRMAAYDIHMLGWLMSALCLVFCAINRAGQDASQRGRGLLWLPAALLLGCALLTKGPLALLFFVSPALLYVLCFSSRRWRDLAWLTGCMILAGGLYAGWYGLIFLQHPEGFSYLLREYRYPLSVEAKPIWYYLIFPAWIFPWTFWLMAALFVPIRFCVSRSDRTWRFAWLWFVLLFVFMSLSPSKSQRYLLPLVPATAILLALYFEAREQSAWFGKSRVLGILSGTNWVMIGTLCVGFPSLIMLQPVLVSDSITAKLGFPGLPDLSVLFGTLLLPALAILFAVAIGLVRRRNLAGGAMLVALLTLIASSVAYYSYAASKNNGSYPHRTDAENVRACIMGKPLFYLSCVADEDRIDPFALEKKDRDPDKEFLIYYRGIIPPATEARIREMLKAGTPFYVCARDTADRAGILDGIGLRYCLSFEDGGGPVWKLFEPR